MVTLFVLRVAVYSSSFEQLLQHLFQLLGSEFWLGNLAILYVFCIAWNDIFGDSFAQPFPKLGIWDLPQLLGSVGFLKFRHELGQWGVVSPQAEWCMIGHA